MYYRSGSKNCLSKGSSESCAPSWCRLRSAQASRARMEMVLRRVAPDISTWFSGAAATGHIPGKILASPIEPGCSYLHCACYSSLTRIPHRCWLCFAWHSSSTQFFLARCSQRLMYWPAQARGMVSEHFSGVRVSRDAPGTHAAREVTRAQ